MASTSSLLKSAASIRNQVATYQDQLMAFEYGNSAYTDSALSSYSSYLKSRIASLSSSGSIADASKALSLTKALDSATKSNISATIQRENIQVLSGNASLTDKYNVVADQFVRAQANGDMTLAQTLEGQAYSLSQSIQLQAQTAHDAGVALAKANATSEGNIVTNLETGLKQLNTTLQHTGQKDFNSTIQQWVANNKATFNALGVDIPAGMQPNYWNVVNGVMGAMYNHDQLAYNYLVATDPQAAQAYLDRATALHNGGSTVPTLAGDRTAQQVQQAMSNPSMFVYDQNTGKFVESAQTGYQFNPNSPMNPSATYSGTVKQPTFLSATQTAQMAALGLVFGQNPKTNTTGNGVEVQATDSSPQWLKDVLGKNGVTNVFATGAGLQFQADSVSGSGKAIFTVAGDGTAWESSALGDKQIANPNNINQMQPGQPKSVFGQIGDAFKSGMQQVDTLLNGHASAGSLPSSMLSQYAAPAQTLPPISVAKPVALPTLSIAAPAPAPAIAPAAPAPTIAPATVSPQAPSGLSVQSSSTALQGGGRGFSLQ